jgi:DNA-binding response OmpR family regulator
MPLPYALRPQSRRKALVASENPRARQYLQEALSRAGYASESCSDVQMLLEPRRTDGHTFVILNDDIDSCEVVRQMRSSGGGIPAILLSRRPDNPAEVSIPGLERLSTPFTLRTLEAAIARVSPALSWSRRSK